MVHDALQNYLCTIDNLVVEAPQAFAKVTFSDIQCKTSLGYAPTNKHLTWVRCALFTFSGEKISQAWVLGDLHSLYEQLSDNQT